MCKLDTQGICIGCLRSLDEIAQWISMSDAEREAVIQLLETRRQLAS